MSAHLLPILQEELAAKSSEKAERRPARRFLPAFVANLVQAVEGYTRSATTRLKARL